MDSKLLLAALFVTLLLCPSGSAWGPVASKFICHEAVKFAWGVDAVAECLPLADKGSFSSVCETTYRVMGADYESKCEMHLSNATEIHPSLLSYDVFGDVGNHYDFSHCPIKSGGEKWVCGDPQDRPAYSISEKWFKAAEGASNLCERIYYFCVGASYYADSESTLHQVRLVANDCVGNIEDSIDRSISNGLTDWSSSQRCKFDNGNQGMEHNQYYQVLGESSNTVNRIISGLASRGSQLKSIPYGPGRGVVLLGNSIDYGMASGFVEYLKASGVGVVYSDAPGFEKLKYNRRIIILGGHNSPEGVGAVSGLLLPAGAKESLMAPGSDVMFTVKGHWAQDQTVIVLAGNEAADTVRAWSDNRETILVEIKAGD
ncbi:MAG: hypothetical protein V1744_07285 [Candidatus Altiarchaeota archaeon]